MRTHIAGFDHTSGLRMQSFALILLLFGCLSVSAQPILFDFDSAPASSPLPITQTAGGITAHFAATGQGYSIQPANTMGFTPAGFAGNCIYPSSISLSDLLIRFDQALVDFSIMYSVHELGCDNSATMRVTAYMNGSVVGTNTKVASQPGTWPVDTLRCSFAQGFDSVVVHYDKPPVCGDYGTIFMADNMLVTPLVAAVEPEGQRPDRFALWQNYPNPFNPGTTITYRLATRTYVSLRVFDVLGREVAILVHGVEDAGYRSVRFNANGLVSGVYYYRLQAGNFVETRKLEVLK